MEKMHLHRFAKYKIFQYSRDHVSADKNTNDYCGQVARLLLICNIVGYKLQVNLKCVISFKLRARLQ